MTMLKGNGIRMGIEEGAMHRDELPLVSVVIPTYNRRNTLPVSLDSVLNQTYSALEVIIVDDGSSDGTEDYVRGLADERVRYFRNTVNRGPSAARNRGVELARGAYVAFQDSDDEWLPDKLEKQMALFRDTEKDLGMVYCEFAAYWEGKRKIVIPWKEIPYHRKHGDMFQILLLQSLIGTPTMVIRRDAFLDLGGFNETLRAYEDYEFTVRFSQRYAIGFVEEPLVKVNPLPDGVNTRLSDRIRTQAYIVKEMITLLRERGLIETKLSRIQEEAEKIKYSDVFIEEMKQLMDLLTEESEKQAAGDLLAKAEESQRKMMRQELFDLKQRILKTYLDIYGDNPVENEAVKQTLYQVSTTMLKCMEIFQMPEELQGAYENTLKQDPETKLDRLFLLTELVTAVETAEAFVEKRMGG